MKKTVLTFGLISGGILSVMMIGTLPFIKQIGFDKAEIIGYTTMVLAFLMIYFGTRSYRDNTLGGIISFGKAFAAGLLITSIACLMYVITWEIIYFKFMPEFGNVYADAAIQQLKNKGATPDAIAKMTKEMQDFKTLYDNPFYNSAITFLEPLPVGLAITLISSLILKKKPAPPASV